MSNISKLFHEQELLKSRISKILYSSIDSMFEIKYANKDIQVYVKSK